MTRTRRFANWSTSDRITSYNVCYTKLLREDVVFSVIINRWHDNVAFLFDEQSQLDPSKDQANFIFDFVGRNNFV